MFGCCEGVFVGVAQDWGAVVVFVFEVFEGFFVEFGDLFLFGFVELDVLVLVMGGVGECLVLFSVGWDLFVGVIWVFFAELLDFV